MEWKGCAPAPELLHDDGGTVAQEIGSDPGRNPLPHTTLPRPSMQVPLRFAQIVAQLSRTIIVVDTMQRPPVQVAPEGHARSQLPQCARLVVVSTHAPPHTTCPRVAQAC